MKELLNYDNNNNKVDTCTLYSVHGRGAYFFLRFGHGSILVQIIMQHSQAQPYAICTRVIYLTQTHLYVEYHTEKQLVPFLKSLV